jgi:GTP-binding protein HflX
LTDFADTSDFMPHAVLIGVDLGQPHFDAELEELGLLAQTGGLHPVAHITCKRKAPDPALVCRQQARPKKSSCWPEQHGAS